MKKFKPQDYYFKCLVNPKFPQQEPQYIITPKELWDEERCWSDQTSEDLMDFLMLHHFFELGSSIFEHSTWDGTTRTVLDYNQGIALLTQLGFVANNDLG